MIKLFWPIFENGVRFVYVFYKKCSTGIPSAEPPTFPFRSGVPSGAALLFDNALSMPMPGQVEKRGICCGHHPFEQISGPENLP